MLNRKIWANSIWMMSEKLIYLFGIIFVTSFMAKYIGPENFGKLAFSTSIFAIIQAISMFGLENIIFHKVSKRRIIGEQLIKATKVIRYSLFIFLSPIALLYVYITSDYLTFVFSISVFLATYFAIGNEVYNIYFNATLKSEINMVCNSLGLILSLILRYIVPFFEMDAEWLGLSIVALPIVPFFLKKIIYNRIAFKENTNRRMAFYRKYTLRVGSKLVLYSLSIALYIQCIQLILGMYSKYELGLFSVAFTLGNSFYFILSAVISSFMTKIYAEKDFMINQITIAKLNWFVIFVSFLAFGGVYFFGEFVVVFLYGEEYKVVKELLYWSVISCCFSGLATVSEKYLFKFKEYEYLNKKTIILAVINLIFSLAFIPIYGLYGAIAAMVTLQIISAVIYSYVFKPNSANVIADSHSKMFFLLMNSIRRIK